MMLSPPQTRRKPSRRNDREKEDFTAETNGLFISPIPAFESNADILDADILPSSPHERSIVDTLSGSHEEGVIDDACGESTQTVFPPSSEPPLSCMVRQSLRLVHHEHFTLASIALRLRCFLDSAIDTAYLHCMVVFTALTFHACSRELSNTLLINE